MAYSFGPTFKKDCLIHLTDFIVQRDKEAVDKLLKEIYLANFELVDHLSLNFRYEGKTYLNDAVKWGRPPLLDESLHAKMDKYIKIENDTYMNNLRITSVLKRALNLSNNCADMVALIPKVLYDVIPLRVKDYASREDALITEDAIKEFKTKNHNHLALVHEAHLLNMLMDT